MLTYFTFSTFEKWVMQKKKNIIEKREKKHTNNNIKKVHVTVYVCVWVSGCLCGWVVQGVGRCGVLARGVWVSENSPWCF